MERTLGDLLELACRRILELDRPACVKNGEMRYLAVNPAYAALYQREPHDFIRRRESELAPGRAAEERERREARVLSGGAPDSVRIVDAGSGAVHTLEIEPFATADGISYLYIAEPAAGLKPLEPAPLDAAGEDHPQIFFDGGLLSDDLDFIRRSLEQAPFPVGIFADDGRPLVANAAFRRRTPPVAPGEPGGITLPVEQALGLLDIGIGVFGPDNRLLYANQRMSSFFAPIVGPLTPGLSLAHYYGATWDYADRHDSAETLASLGPREDYVAARLADCDQPFSDRTVETCLGGYLRCINRRLDSGTLLMVRIDATVETERENRLTAQLAEIELYRNVLEELPVAVFVRDAAHRLVYANGAYGRLLGRDLGELRGRTEVEIYGEAGERIARINQQVLDSGQLNEMHDSVRDGEGRPRAVMSRANRLVASDGTTYIAGSMMETAALLSPGTAADGERIAPEGPAGPAASPVRVLLVDPDEARGEAAAATLSAGGIDCVAIADAALTAAIVCEAAGLGVPVDVVALAAPVESRLAELTLATGRPVVPLALLEAVLARAWTAPPAPTPAAPAERTQRALLIAEDDPAALIVWSRTLQDLGLGFETVNSGGAAIALWQAMRPRLILMDTTLPDINGYEATLAIRAIESASGLTPTVIIGLSGAATDLDRDRARSAGMDDMLLKPVSPDLLAARIHRWLPDRSSREA